MLLFRSTDNGFEWHVLGYGCRAAVPTIPDVSQAITDKDDHFFGNFLVEQPLPLASKLIGVI